MAGLLMRSLVAWIILAVAFAIADALLDDLTVDGGFLTLLWVSFLFAIVAGLLGPLLRLISLPLTLITFGLFSLVINGVLLVIVAWISSNLEIDGFFVAILGAIIISVVSTVLAFLVPDSLGGAKPA